MRVLSFRIPLRFLRGSYSRLALTVIALACGVALVVAIRVMNAAVMESFLDTVDEVGGRADFSVVASDGASFDDRVANAIGQVAGIRLAVPLVNAVAFPNDDSGELLTIHGVDLTNDAAVRLYHRASSQGATEEIVDDLLAFLNQADSVILTQEFANSRGISKGSRIDLVTPRGVQSFTVRGLLEPQGLAKTLGGRLVVMDVMAAQGRSLRTGRSTE